MRDTRRRRLAIECIAIASLLVAGTAAAEQPAVSDPEARVSLDVKDAPIAKIASLLGEAAGVQVVVDPDVSCSLTLKLREARWQQVLESSLRACRLASEGAVPLLRVAPLQRLEEETAARRRLAEARQPDREPAITTFRLSHARAAEIAPLLKKYLSSRGQVSYDARTNTLIIVD